MSDIVERLRARDAYLSLDEADDEIERLRGLLREAADDKLLSVAIELGTTKARLAEAVELLERVQDMGGANESPELDRAIWDFLRPSDSANEVQK